MKSVDNGVRLRSQSMHELPIAAHNMDDDDDSTITALTMRIVASYEVVGSADRSITSKWATMPVLRRVSDSNVCVVCGEYHDRS